MSLSNDSPAIVFYDIAFRPPVESTTTAPNPWKARYALNFKAVPYKTHWVPMPDISKVRQQVGAPACRKFADGNDFYTLPMLTDSTTNSIIGDSFDIAIYLQKTYPDSGGGDLFPVQTLDYVYKGDTSFFTPLSERDEGLFGEYVRFNTNIDAVFSVHVQLMAHGLPFDPAYAEEIKKEFARRAGGGSWDDFAIKGEERRKLMVSLRETLADLVKLFKRNESGPFILGQQASYADFIVGGWLRMMRGTLPQSEWEEVMGWYDGVFERLFQALKTFAEVK